MGRLYVRARVNRKLWACILLKLQQDGWEDMRKGVIARRVLEEYGEMCMESLGRVPTIEEAQGVIDRFNHEEAGGKEKQRKVNALRDEEQRELDRRLLENRDMAQDFDKETAKKQALEIIERMKESEAGHRKVDQKRVEEEKQKGLDYVRRRQAEEEQPLDPSQALDKIKEQVRGEIMDYSNRGDNVSEEDRLDLCDRVDEAESVEDVQQIFNHFLRMEGGKPAKEAVEEDEEEGGAGANPS